jgi:hypothetical protein
MFFINPFIYAGGGDFESIATVTVGSGGAASIEFTSIPSTYQHLQIRMIGKSTTTTGEYHGVRLQMNGATGSVYSWHVLYGTGSSVGAGGAATRTSIEEMHWVHDSAASRANMFAPVIVDILDYANTSKFKTMRSFAGCDFNGGAGPVGIYSGLYQATTAVSSLKFFPASGNFAQHTTAALYGVRA